jgi:hypothetical protein
MNFSSQWVVDVIGVDVLETKSNHRKTSITFVIVKIIAVVK